MKVKNRYMVFLSNNTFEYIPKHEEEEAELSNFSEYRKAIFKNNKTGEQTVVRSVYDTKEHRIVVDVEFINWTEEECDKINEILKGE